MLSENLNKSVNINRYRVSADSIDLQSDPVAVEEVLLIRLKQAKICKDFGLLMRTPGNDLSLVYGILFSENIIQQVTDVLSIDKNTNDNHQQENIVDVVLSENIKLNLAKLERGFPSYSGCGLCGKSSLQALELKQRREFKPIKTQLSIDHIVNLKRSLSKQPQFSLTGGVHAAGIVYEKQGKLDYAEAKFFEDVGRHNALDKLIGSELVNNNLKQPGIIILSGRISFELVQKVTMAGFSTIVALGAPSQLAINTAIKFNIVLIGFAKKDQFNLYTPNLSVSGKSIVVTTK